MPTLTDFENKSIFVLREVKKRFKNPVLLWSMGKDSTVLLWLCKKAFYGKIPFKILHIDTETEFDETYNFRDELAKKWNLNLIIGKTKGSFENNTCTKRKTEILKQQINQNKFDAAIVGIRRDEHGIRSMEHYFSPRDNEFKWNVVKDTNNKIEPAQDPEFSDWGLYATEFKKANHVRIHPLLHWTESDVWKYIKQEKIPILNLYFSEKGYRFRSIGCKCCSSKIKSNSKDIDDILDEIDKDKHSEREGRDTEKEYQMQKLRSLGYL